MTTPTRTRFTALFIACAGASSLPGLVVAYQMHGWASVAAFLSPALISTAISVQVLYGAAGRRLRLHRMPWFQCICVTLIAYVGFGLLISLYSIAVNEATGFGWPVVGPFLTWWWFMSIMGLMITGWLALPMSVLLAFWLKQSNNEPQSPGPVIG